MKKSILFTLIILSVATSAMAASGKVAVGYAIAKNPSILLEPWFWIVVVVCLILVGIYYITKDKK